MATRDLTRAFTQQRDAAKAKSLRRRNIVSGGDEGNALMTRPGALAGQRRDLEAATDSIPPTWVSIVNDSNEHVALIKEKMDKLSKLHTKRLMVRFDDSESRDEQEINQLTQQITTEFRNAERSLQRMSKQTNLSQADAKTRQNVQRALATQLQTLSSEFRRTQKEYLAKVKVQKQQGAVEFDFLAEDSRNTRRGMDMGFNKAQITEVEIANDLMNERDQEIQKIAESITELATIFKELAVLVIDQGTILDRIDYNMEQVVEQTEKGIVELEKAEQIQKNSRPMKCIGLLLALILVMTILLVLKHMH